MAESKALTVVPTAVQKQQVVAAFTQSGTLERARPLIAALWGLEEASLPDDAALREIVADIEVVPSKEVVALTERLAQAQHRGKLLDFEETVIEGAKAKVRDGSPKFFNLMGALKIIGERVDPMVAKNINVFNMPGARFKTRSRHIPRDEEAVEGEFEEVEGD